METPSMHSQPCVYILASKSRRLYVGVTSDLQRRLAQHIVGTLGGFTSRYAINRLVHVETTRRMNEAIAREKQLKNWRRSKKIELIEALNPMWENLSVSWKWRT
jgi:putative endonuclease